MKFSSRLNLVVTFLFAVVLAFATNDARAQSTTIRGVILDEQTNSPVKAASVEQLGNAVVVFSDEAGRFTLRVDRDTVTLRVRHIGYADFVHGYELTASESSVRIHLIPDPVVLSSIQVMTDRFEARRRAAPFSVRAYTTDDLAASSAFDGLDFLRERTNLTPCPTSPFGARFPVSATGDFCILHRGAWTVPRVFVDDAPQVAGMSILRGWSTADFYRIEVARRGGGIEFWIYTQGFAKWLTQGKASLQPYIINR